MVSLEFYRFVAYFGSIEDVLNNKFKAITSKVLSETSTVVQVERVNILVKLFFKILWKKKLPRTILKQPKSFRISRAFWLVSYFK